MTGARCGAVPAPCARTTAARSSRPPAAGSGTRSRTSAPSTPHLTLGPGLHLPYEAVTETFAIVAKRGFVKALAVDTPVATPAREVGADGQVVSFDPSHPLNDAMWANNRLGKATMALSNGYCGLPLNQTCETANVAEHLRPRLPELRVIPAVLAPPAATGRAPS